MEENSEVALYRLLIDNHARCLHSLMRMPVQPAMKSYIIAPHIAQHNTVRNNVIKTRNQTRVKAIPRSYLVTIIIVNIIIYTDNCTQQIKWYQLAQKHRLYATYTCLSRITLTRQPFSTSHNFANDDYNTKAIDQRVSHISFC